MWKERNEDCSTAGGNIAGQDAEKGETDRMKIAVAIIFLVAAVFGLLGTD